MAFNKDYFKSKFNEVRDVQEKTILYCILEELVKLNEKFEAIEKEVVKEEPKKTGATTKK